MLDAASPRTSRCMPDLEIGHRHGAEGVAVIAAAEADEAVRRLRCPELSQYWIAIFMRDLDRDRAGIGEEHAIEIARQKCRKPRASVSACSCTSPPNITCGMISSWRCDRLPDMRMIVAVTGGPPRRDAVDKFAAVGEMDARAFACAPPASGGRRGLHLRIGQPDVVEAGAGTSRAFRASPSHLHGAQAEPVHQLPVAVGGRDSAWSAASARRRSNWRRRGNRAPASRRSCPRARPRAAPSSAAW